ncbi:MAG: hypothetical protein ABIO17_08885 [Pseudoxanthomonas sp.]
MSTPAEQSESLPYLLSGGAGLAVRAGVLNKEAQCACYAAFFDWPLYPMTGYAIEGNIKAALPECKGQHV